MPKILILIAPPGAGKTTWAKRYISSHPNTKYLSSDDIRIELFGSDRIQKEPWKVFRLMEERAKDHLISGHDVIYDATNINRKNRHSIINTVYDLDDIEIIAIDLNVPMDKCIEQDRNRDRTVGEDVIRRYYQNYQPPSYAEGFDEIIEVV